MRCINFTQLVAGLILVLLVSMLLGFGRLGSLVSLGLLVWYVAGFVVSCDNLTAQAPTVYTEGLAAAPAPAGP